MKPKYLLDTNQLVFASRGGLDRIDQTLPRNLARCLIPSLVSAEFLRGVSANLTNPKERRIEHKFLRDLIELSAGIEAFTAIDAEIVGKIVSELKEDRKPVPGVLDLMIAAIGRRTKTTVVTDNKKDFVNIRRLLIVNWVS